MCSDARWRRLRIAPDMGPARISPVIQRSEAMNETQTEVHGGSCCRGHEPKKAGPIIDPVCGMAVDPAITVHHAAHGGETYHRSEEHTSELQSLMRISYAVFCLKKKNILANKTIVQNKTQRTHTHIVERSALQQTQYTCTTRIT